jgi:5'-phosphate synthase pdxT subunit
MKIGVLALQGDFAEHVAMLKRLNVETVEVRLPNHLEGLDGLIIPGGESTTIGKLSVAYDLMEPLKLFGQRHAIWGTCAGAIFISKDIGRNQPLLGLMDIKVQRNAFGRQIDSFETDLDIPELKKATGTTGDYHAVSSALRSLNQSVVMQRSSLQFLTGELLPPKRDISWLHHFTLN